MLFLYVRRHLRVSFGPSEDGVVVLHAYRYIRLVDLHFDQISDLIGRNLEKVLELHLELDFRANMLLELPSEIDIDFSEVVAIDYRDVEGLIVEELRQLVDVVIELKNQDSKGLQVDFEVEDWHDDRRVVLIISFLPISEKLIILNRHVLNILFFLDLEFWLFLFLNLFLELELVATLNLDIEILLIFVSWRARSF